MSGLLEKISNKLHTSEVREEAPVVKERIHEHAEHVDKTHVQEAHERTQVEQVVQPLVDERHENLKTRTEDHGTEVHEHGRAGLDRETEAELEARRAKIAATGGTTVDRRETDRSERPDVEHTERVHTVEQVIPVQERDIYKPEVIEHHKKQVEIVHDAPELKGTKIKPAMKVSEWESQGHHVSSHGTESRRRGSSSSSSSSSSDDEKRRAGGDYSTTKKKGLGEKLKEAVTGKETTSTSGTTSSRGLDTTTGTTSGTGYQNESLGEKVGDKLSGRDTTTGTTSGTGYGQESLGEKVGDKLSGRDTTTGTTSGTGYQQESLGEKIGDKLTGRDTTTEQQRAPASGGTFA